MQVLCACVSFISFSNVSEFTTSRSRLFIFSLVLFLALDDFLVMRISL